MLVAVSEHLANLNEVFIFDRLSLDFAYKRRQINDVYTRSDVTDNGQGWSNS